MEAYDEREEAPVSELTVAYIGADAAQGLASCFMVGRLLPRVRRLSLAGSLGLGLS